MITDPIRSYRFDTIESPVDKRDKLASTLLEAEDPDRTLLERWVFARKHITIYDQGVSSMCTGFTAAQRLKQAHYLETGKLEDFSWAFTYGDRGTGYKGEGDFLRSTNKQICKNGCCLLEDFNFIGTYEETAKRYEALPDKVKTAARHYKYKTYYRVNMKDPEEAKKVLDKYGIILEGSIPLYRSFTEAYRNGGIVPIPDKENEKFYGGHAVAIVGYKYIDGRLYYIIANSWGTKYGDEGFFYIPADYPWYEAWLTFDYRKMKIEIPTNPKDVNNQKKICFVNGKPVEMHARAIIKDGRTMVPVRTISELIGMEVGWDGETQEVTITEYATNIHLKIGRTSIFNSYSLSQVEMDVAPFILDSRTYVPIRFISEILRLKVMWDAERRMAVILNY